MLSGSPLRSMGATPHQGGSAHGRSRCHAEHSRACLGSKLRADGSTGRSAGRTRPSLQDRHLLRWRHAAAAARGCAGSQVQSRRLGREPADGVRRVGRSARSVWSSSWSPCKFRMETATAPTPGPSAGRVPLSLSGKPGMSRCRCRLGSPGGICVVTFSLERQPDRRRLSGSCTPVATA